MRLDYVQTLDDVAALRRARVTPGQRAAGFVLVGFFGLLCVGVGAFGYFSREAGGWWVLPLVFLGLVVGQPFLSRWELRRKWRRQHPFGPPRVVVEFREDGVFIETAAQRTHLQWHAFTHFRDTPRLFLLYQGRGFLRFFPKRAFVDAEAIARLKSVLEDKIGRTKYSPEPPGFLVKMGDAPLSGR